LAELGIVRWFSRLFDRKESPTARTEQADDVGEYPRIDADPAYPLTRSVSKTGGFGLARPEAEYLARRISDEDAARLYVLIRDEAFREESEWRPEFLVLFPGCADLLPPSQDPEFDPQCLFDLIELSLPEDIEGYLDTFEEFLERTKELGVDPSSLTKEGLSLRSFAEKFSNDNVIEILDLHRVE